MLVVLKVSVSVFCNAYGLTNVSPFAKFLPENVVLYRKLHAQDTVQEAAKLGVGLGELLL